MSRMDTYLAKFPEAAVVRWPFRVLGAVLVVASISGLAGALYAAFVGYDIRLALFALAMLPTIALICRSTGFAVVAGRTPPSPFWPFASGKVAFIWILVALIICKWFMPGA
jgi:hypothetical protein